jgi:hypothetical protein
MEEMGRWIMREVNAINRRHLAENAGDEAIQDVDPEEDPSHDDGVDDEPDRPIGPHYTSPSPRRLSSPLGRPPHAGAASPVHDAGDDASRGGRIVVLSPGARIGVAG